MALRNVRPVRTVRTVRTVRKLLCSLLPATALILGLPVIASADSGGPVQMIEVAGIQASSSGTASLVCIFSPFGRTQTCALPNGVLTAPIAPSGGTVEPIQVAGIQAASTGEAMVLCVFNASVNEAQTCGFGAA